MSDTIIQVENLGKKYIIGHQQEGVNRHKTLRDAIANGVKSLYHKPAGKRIRNLAREEFWSLKDVSFEIKQGEVVGIVGRNGAGKSTLLKILSRITEPTTGRVSIEGRVASLLEVGTGFHPELTGRENIYLNGAVLGMSRTEIKKKFDEIVDFAGTKKFLDTPVKRYSSGMYVRLAFAVAAHLEPEILIVDEVLAVGDAQFQKKCLGKMQDVSTQQGRTVLFVSHNMVAIRALCQNAIVLESGKLVMRATVGKVIDRYLNAGTEDTISHTVTFPKPANTHLWIKSATVICGGVPGTQLYMGETLSLQISFQSEIPVQSPKIGFVVHSVQGEAILNVNNRYQSSESLPVPVLSGDIFCQLGTVPLMEGRYLISLWLGDPTRDYHNLEYTLSFEVIEQDIWGNGKTPPQNSSFLWWPTSFKVSSPVAIEDYTNYQA